VGAGVELECARCVRLAEDRLDPRASGDLTRVVIPRRCRVAQLLQQGAFIAHRGEDRRHERLDGQSASIDTDPAHGAREISGRCVAYRAAEWSRFGEVNHMALPRRPRSKTGRGASRLGTARLDCVRSPAALRVTALNRRCHMRMTSCCRWSTTGDSTHFCAKTALSDPNLRAGRDPEHAGAGWRHGLRDRADTDELRTDGASEVQDVYVRPPLNASSAKPLQALIALHGMGGNGRDFGEALGSEADQYGWLIVAPTIKYGDWTDPAPDRARGASPGRPALG